MTASEKEREKRMAKKMEKSWMTYLGGYKTSLLTGLLTATIGVLMLSHGFSESWAWEIAKSVITIDGIILGFTIIGVTLFSSERIYSTSRMVDIFKEHFVDFWKELKVMELSNYGKIQRKFASSVESAITDILVVPTSIPACMVSLVISIAFALSLFGVSDVTVDNIVLKSVFTIALFLSIAFLMIGIYLAIKFTQEFVSQTSRAQMLEAYKKSLETFIKECEDAVAEKKDKE